MSKLTGSCSPSDDELEMSIGSGVASGDGDLGQPNRSCGTSGMSSQSLES